jgi:hypothetical protein
MNQAYPLSAVRFRTTELIISDERYEVTFIYIPAITPTFDDPGETESVEIEEINRVWQHKRIPCSAAIFEAANSTGLYDEIYRFWADKCLESIHTQEELYA